MGRLTLEEVQQEVQEKGFELVDFSHYTSMISPITIKCNHGHLIETNLKDFRRASFTCPVCDKSINFINPKDVPEKKGYRIIAFDQATEKFGLSIFEDGKLIFYRLYTFSGALTSRLVKIQKFVEEIVIAAWKPDLIVMEDIQYQQNGLTTFKVLAMLLGVIQMTCTKNDVNYEAVYPNVWRKYAGTCGKSRKEEKALSIAKVREKYNIIVNDDVAEAILIGSYATRVHQAAPNWAFGI